MCVCENKSIFPVILDKAKIIIIIKQQQEGKKNIILLPIS